MPTQDACQLHLDHSPANATVEVHHIIPVAWQTKMPWKPPVAPYPGKDPDGRGELWDDRTVTACPTGHRNIHYWIVRIMHKIESSATVVSLSEAELVDHAIAALHIVRGQQQLSIANSQLSIARQAAIRYAAAGGRLLDLCAAGEWGES